MAKLHLRYRNSRIILPILSYMMVMPVQAEWQYNGQNTLTAEFYDVDGAQDRGLYSEQGSQRYNDLYVNFSNYASPYKNVRGYVQASVNDSAYRLEQGGQISALSLSYENGENKIPTRLMAGDFYANQSQRTLQRGLKGIQVELQPVGWSTPHSIQFFGGRVANNYDAFFSDEDKDFFAGGSWLIEDTSLGSFAFTTVHYENSAADVDAQEQVTSLAWEKLFSIVNFDYALEVELAHLNGETFIDDSLAANSRLIELTGYGSDGQSVLVSFQRNDRDFSPQGGSVVANRQSLDMQWGQRLYKQMNVRLRRQHYIDSLDDENQQQTDIYGINLIGLPFEQSDLNVNVDVSLRQQQDDDRSYDADSWAVNMNLSLPITARWRARANYQWQKSQDKLNDVNSFRRFSSVGVDFTTQWRGWYANLSPSLNYNQDIDGQGSETSQFSGGLVLSAQRNGHSLLLSHQHVYFDAKSEFSQQFNTMQTTLQWQAQWQQHRLQLNFDRYAFDQEAVTSNSYSYKASISWTYQFEKMPAAYQTSQQQSQAFDQFYYLDDVQLNRVYGNELNDKLADAGWSEAGQNGVFDLYAGRLFEDISNRQILAIEKRANQVQTANVVIELANLSASSVERLYNDILDDLLTIYGRPLRERSVGAIDQNWQQSLNANKLVRIVEWQTKNGILRFGLPKPLTGRARLELQLTNKQRDLDNNNWGSNVLF